MLGGWHSHNNMRHVIVHNCRHVPTNQLNFEQQQYAYIHTNSNQTLLHTYFIIIIETFVILIVFVNF